MTLKEHYDYLLVGAGLFNAAFAYQARKHGKSVLVIEKRDHIGGNCHTELVEGIPVHKYGAHIFHTDNENIWNIVCDNCCMRPFINSPIAVYYDEVYNLPFNMNTFAKIFGNGVLTPFDAKERIEKEIELYKVDNPKNLEEQAINLVGKTVYRKLVKEYTEKQWGRDCKELPPDIIKRLPVRFSYDNNYFNDRFQGVPEFGYDELINNFFGPDTEALVGENFLDNKDYAKLADKVIYTGPIDEYFNYSLGALDWRTVHFDVQTFDIQDMQGNAVYNYTSHDKPYTRSIEHKHFHKYLDSFKKNKTVVSFEYSKEFEPGDEPYYPVNNEKNAKLLEEYRKLAENEQNVYFAGRLGEYKYYDMDDTIDAAFKLYDKLNQ